MAARPVPDVPTGWCSWYELYTSVRASDVERNLAQVVDRQAQLPLGVVQIDDGYQAAVGDWLTPNEKFPAGLAPLAAAIRAEGLRAGLWLAPFLLSAHSQTFADHPDWVVRAPDDTPVVAIHNWGAPHYALDTTHPAALAWLAEVVRTVGERWGFDYLKLDFLYAAALRGRRHDPSATSVAAYRQGLGILREAAGDRFVLGCGAPLLPSVGLVDGMRIGTDVAAEWGTEGNADGPALRHATRATLARGWMHGVWWANDPDCVVIRARASDLSRDEVQAWAAVVALSGGLVFVGDDLAAVEPDRLALLARLLPPAGEAAVASTSLTNLIPDVLRLHVERPWASWDIVAIANWGDEPAARAFEPARVGIGPVTPYHVFDLWQGEYRGRQRGIFDLGVLAPHTLRLLSIHLDLGRPQTVGGTGHLFGEAMDLATEHWSLGLHELTVLPSTAGVRGRRGELVVYDPHGPLRRVPFSDYTDGPTTLSFDPLG
jgi:alpha-galactosidase